MLRNWFFSRVMQPFLKTILYLNYLPQLQSGIKLPVTDRFSWFFRICPCHAKPTTGRILLRLDLNCVICKAITVFHVDIPFTKNFVPISIRIGKLRVLHVWNLSCKFHWYQKKNSFYVSATVSWSILKIVYYVSPDWWNFWVVITLTCWSHASVDRTKILGTQADCIHLW